MADATYDEVDTKTQTVDHRGSTVTSGGNVNLTSTENILIEGSHIAADINDAGQGDVNLAAGNNVTIKEATDTYDSNTKEIHGKAELSVVVQHQAVEVAKALIAVDEAKDQLEQAKKDYKKYEKDLDNLQNTLNALEADYANKIPGVSYEDVLELRELVDDVKGDKEWYVAGITLAAVNLTSKTTALVQQTAAAGQSTATYGFNAGVQLDIDASKTTTSIKETTAVASTVSGNNINIQTGVGKNSAEGTSTNIGGSHLQAKETLAINTGELNITASKNTQEIDSNTEQGHISAQMTAYGAAAGGVSVNADFSRSKNSETHTTINNSTLTADNIQLSTTGDTNIRGGNVHADSTLVTDIGGDLNVESLQNRSRTKNNSAGISGGFSASGGDVTGVNGGINASNGMSTTRETVRSSLTSGGTADITVAGNTQITAATIATLDADGNDLGNLNLNTGSLSFTDLRDTHQSNQTSGGISTSLNVGGTTATEASQNQQLATDSQGRELDPNTSNITYSNNSQYDASKALATLGTGNITIGGKTDSEENPHESLTGLNRDTTNTTKDLWSVERQEGNVDLAIDHRLLSEDGRKEIKEDFKRTEILGESIADMADGSVSFLGNSGEGESSLREHIGNTQDFFTATKNFVNDVNNAEHVSVINDGNATPEQKQAAYSALANSIAMQTGVSPVEAMVLVQEEYNLNTRTYDGTTIQQQVQGAYAQNPNSQHQEGLIFVVDDNIATTNQAVNVVGHETMHHIDSNKNVVVTDQTAYDTNRENYADLMGNATEDYLGFNFATSGNGTFGTTNNRVDSNTNNAAVKNNNAVFNALDQREVDYRQLAIPEISYVRDESRVDRFANYIEEQTGETLSHAEASARLLQGSAGLIDQKWQEIHGSDAAVMDFLMTEIAGDIRTVAGNRTENTGSEISPYELEQQLLNSNLAYTDESTGERRLIFGLGEGEFADERHGVTAFMSNQTIGQTDALGIPKTDLQRRLDHLAGFSEGQASAVDQPGTVLWDGAVGTASGIWDFVTSPIDTTTGAWEGMKEADAYGRLLEFQGRDHEAGYIEGYAQGSIAVGAVASPIGEAFGTSLLSGALARANGGDVKVTAGAKGEVVGVSITETSTPSPTARAILVESNTDNEAGFTNLPINERGIPTSADNPGGRNPGDIAGGEGDFYQRVDQAERGVISKVSENNEPKVVSGFGSDVEMDGHKIYDSNYSPISTNPNAGYRFSDPNYRSTGGDVYFGENVMTAYFEVRQNLDGKSLYVGEVKVGNILDLTDPSVQKKMNIDPAKLTARVDDEIQRQSVYEYTNQISNQAYDAGYSGILYPSSRKSIGNNSAVVLFGGRYNSNEIKKIMDKQINQRQGN